MPTTHVATPTDEYKNHEEIWQRCRDAISGHHAVKNKETEYLPKLSGMDEKTGSYTKYHQQALFFEASGRTMQAYKGLIFRKEPTFNYPTALDSFMDDMTGDGDDAGSLAEDLVQEELETSRFGLLVDRPDREGQDDLTVAEAEALGDKPFVTRYWAEDILEVKTKTVQGKTKKVRVRLKEKYKEETEEFVVEDRERVRVLDLDNEGYYRQRVFEKKNPDDTDIDFEQDPQKGSISTFHDKEKGVIWVEDPDQERQPKMNGERIDEIPFYMIGGPKFRMPWMTGLVEVNLAHYIKYADYSRGVSWTTRPQPYAAGQKKDTLEGDFIMGGGDLWLFPDPNASVGMLEYSGKGLTAAENDLEGLRNQMAVLGARMLVQESRKVETAEAHAMKRQGENSALATVAKNVEELFVNVMQFAARWSGVQDESTIEEIDASLNKDFLPTEMPAEDMVKLWGLVQAGGLTEDDYFYNLKQGERLDPTKDDEERQAELQTQPQNGMPL